jgi:hypothetical protein
MSEMFKDAVEKAAIDLIKGMLLHSPKEEVLEDIEPSFATFPPETSSAIRRGFLLARDLPLDQGLGLVGGQVPEALRTTMQSPVWDWGARTAEGSAAAYTVAGLTVALAFARFEVEIGPTVRDMLEVKRSGEQFADDFISKFRSS